MPGVTRSEGISTSDWMGEMRDVLGDKPISRVKMPGTHDSATSKVSSKSDVGCVPSCISREMKSRCRGRPDRYDK